MGLTAFVDAVGEHLRAELSPRPPLVGGTEPDGPGQLPAVTLSLAAVTSPHPGVGAVPLGEMTGALAVSVAIALGAAYLDFPDGRMPLLSADRKVVQLPHGAIVRRDGTQQSPFDGHDLTVVRKGDGGPKSYTVVAAAPRATQVRPTAVTGQLVFGRALPAKGSMEVSYFVGTWEVRFEHFAGELHVDAFALVADEADALSRRVEAALAPDRSRRIAGLRRLAPTGWGPLSLSGTGTVRRSLAYRFDYEREEPVVVTAGGPLQRVRVTSTLSVGGTESSDQFDVTRKS